MSGYHVILADPPWDYNKRSNPSTRFGRGAAGHYPLMATEEIAALPVSDWAQKQALLFLWATGPRMPEALRVMEAWGFEYKTVAFTWVKATGGQPVPSVRSEFPPYPARPVFGIGFYSKSNAEFVLLGTRGPALKPATDRVCSVVIAPRGRHSQKPDEVQFRIEAMYPHLRKLEMFARRRRKGWDAWGQEVDG